MYNDPCYLKCGCIGTVKFFIESLEESKRWEILQYAASQFNRGKIGEYDLLGFEQPLYWDRDNFSAAYYLEDLLIQGHYINNRKLS